MVKNARKKNAGVTLIEMLIVLAIFSLVSSILLFNYSDFRTNVSLRNLSQEVALAVRKAQTYATSVRGIDYSGTTRDYPAYGIGFSTEASPESLAPGEKKIVLFVDVPPDEDPEEEGDLFYDYSTGTCGTVLEGEECFEKFQISTPDKISDIEVCTTSTCSSESEVYIVFRRPNPDAWFCVPSGSSCDGTTYSSVTITLESQTGLTKTVSIWNTGQVSVQ